MGINTNLHFWFNYSEDKCFQSPLLSPIDCFLDNYDEYTSVVMQYLIIKWYFCCIKLLGY